MQLSSSAEIITEQSTPSIGFRHAKIVDHAAVPVCAIRGDTGVAHVFITGSSDGLGLMAARLLINEGHAIVLHGRNDGRSRDALAAASGAAGVVPGDLSTIAGARTVAEEVNRLGPFDAVIHNAGVGYRESRVEVEPGVPSVFAINVLAPYILTALIERPKRLV
jgi:NAD(P)-dependent dehydrogenase (short-subunit alcohol dehydrogenase family)